MLIHCNFIESINQVLRYEGRIHSVFFYFLRQLQKKTAFTIAVAIALIGKTKNYFKSELPLMKKPMDTINVEAKDLRMIFNPPVYLSLGKHKTFHFCLIVQKYFQRTQLIVAMGKSQSKTKLSEEDVLFLEENTTMNRAKIMVTYGHKMISYTY